MTIILVVPIDYVEKKNIIFCMFMDKRKKERKKYPILLKK
jgi:hypothetical protein